jgi:hypothetical protein
MSHTSAEPIKAGEGVTSETPTRPASDPAMSSNPANRRLTPRQSNTPCQRGSGQGSHQAEGEPARFSSVRARGRQPTADQPTDATAVSAGPSPYGVESGSTAGQGTPPEPGNPPNASFGMAEATGERARGRRSLHSSPRTGKPSTRRRQAVDTASTQGEGPPGPGPVNTGFILDMQRKLYGWSRDHPERVLSLDTPGSVKVCDNNRNLGCAWKAGCGETRTSGLGRGVRKPAAGRRRGVSLLLR